MTVPALNRLIRAALGIHTLAMVARAAGIPAVPRSMSADFLTASLPQRAAGDFDGDGRPDLAVIREVPGGSQVLVRLSGPSANILLDTSIVSLVAADIDHDGDLDLVAATPSGDLLVWLNDGRGGFTQQDRTPGHSGVSPAAVFGDAAEQRIVAIGPAAPPIVLPGASETPLPSTSARPAAANVPFGRTILSSPTLRAPPLPVGLS